MPEDLDPRYDPRYQRGFRGPGPVPPDTLRARAEDLDPPVLFASAAPPIAERAAVLVERPLTANPVVWGLLVAGTALVVAGIVMFTGWSSLAGGSSQRIDYALLQFLIQVTPVLLGLGGATLLGVGFLFAIDRQRRTRTPVVDPPANPQGR